MPDLLVLAAATLADPDDSQCRGCCMCRDACSFQAITYRENKGVCKVNPAVCTGCTSCSMACPTGAASVLHFKPDEILSMVENAFDTPKW